MAPSSSWANFPPAAYFLLACELTRSFAGYSFHSVYMLYLTSSLGFSEQRATIFYHSLGAVCVVTLLLGGIIADSWLGRYKTLVVSYSLYILAYVAITVSSASDSIPILAGLIVPLSIGAIFIKLIAVGGLVNYGPFAADQFEDDQQPLIQSLFMAFYQAGNIGSICGILTAPVLRAVKCLNQPTCFPLAFGVSATSAAISYILFMTGSYCYIKKKSEGNVVVEVAKCIGHGVANNVKRNKTRRTHWLDRADDKYSATIINDVKALLRMLVLYIPVPLFWALYNQQSSRWLFQSVRMDGGLFHNAIIVQPEQMEVFNPIMILLLIPAFDMFIYPFLGKFHLLQKPLQRMTLGMLLGALAFVISSVVESNVESVNPILPHRGQAQLYLFNSADCLIDVRVEQSESSVETLGIWRTTLNVTGEKGLEVNLTSRCTTAKERSEMLDVIEKKTSIYLISGPDLALIKCVSLSKLDKSAVGNTKVGFIYNFGDTEDRNLTLIDKYGSKEYVELDGENHSTKFIEPKYNSKYKVSIDGTDIGQNIELRRGGVYIVLLTKDDESYKANLETITPFNTFPIYWQIPQIVILAVAEILFSITGLEFSYRQAPKSMKSVVYACWCATGGIGNLIVVFITSRTQRFSSHVYELGFFALLLLLDTLVFILIAYKYINNVVVDDVAEEEEIPLLS